MGVEMTWVKKWPTVDKIENYKLIDPAVMAQPLASKREYKNKVPTHDPYSNPDSHIYYECACGAILDPGTKSFAQLNNAASNAGWKIRFGHEYYVPYCVKCGEGVE